MEVVVVRMDAYSHDGGYDGLNRNALMVHIFECH